MKDGVKFLKELLTGLALAAFLYLFWAGYNVLPVVFLGGLVLLLSQSTAFKNMSGQMDSIGGGYADTSINFDDIGGQATAKRELLEALDFVKRLEDIRHLGIRPLKGILLAGPPGTGKTLLAKAAANYTRSVFVSASGSQFIEMYAGVGAQRVRKLFSTARKKAKDQQTDSAVLFIDEIEVVAGKRGRHSSHLEYDQTLNQLLVEMDGIGTDEEVKIVVIGATNRQDLLDDALLRPGRFDRVVNVDLPGRKGRHEIIHLHTRNKPLADDIDLEDLARETFGFSGAHIESLANEAAIQALREGKDLIEVGHFREALTKVIMGEKLDRRPSKEEQKRIGYHEAAHALVAETIRPGSVQSATIASRSNTLGHVRHIPEDDVYLYTRDYLVGQIQVLLAGAQAEEEFFGSKSSGAANDFEKAWELAETMVGAGMSDLGVVKLDRIDKEQLRGAVQTILVESEERCREQVVANRHVLKELAEELLSQETISGERIRELIEANVH